MSFKTGSAIDNNNLKFFELRKYLVSNENNGINCIACHNSQQTVFVANDNQLMVISIDHLLNFVWNKSVINEIVDKFEHISIGLNFYAHFISISAKGFGTKAAVCGSNDENESPFITFFDLNSVYKTRNKSTAYSRINLMNSKGLVTDIVWHPEICDNQFGCCLTDGSVFIISIGDVEWKTTTILSHIPSSMNAMSLCWSPKGKQIVIGFKNGYFSQYKLTNGQQLQEVKKTVLANNMTDYSILSIKWIVSSLFAIGCTKDVDDSEKDTHIILVSTPSKGLAQFFDFGAICLDNFEVNDSYRINLLHFENMILCSTSIASDVAVIGCDSSKDISLPENWCQWMLDDNSRIDLPMDRDGNDTYLRGIAISKGTQNVFNINAHEAYGGINCPILMIYNSSGILLPYLIVVKSGGIKVPEAPKIVKPAVVPSVTPQAPTNTSTPIPSSVTFNPQQIAVTPKPSSISSFGSPFTPIASSTSIESKPIPKPSQQQMVATNQTSRPNTQSMATQQSISAPKSDLSNLKPINSNPESEANYLYMDAMTEQINEFNKVMSATKRKFMQIKAKIGEKEEEMKLRANTRLIDEVLNEIKENFKNFSKDTTTLQASLIESFSLVEEANSIMDRNVDPKYRFLLKQRSLDPITARRMEEINSSNEYIQTQLRELDAKFEQEWCEWLEKRKPNKTTQSVARIHSSTSCEMIYKALANNQRIINSLRLQLDNYEGLSSPQSIKTKSSLIKQLKSPIKKDIEKLAQSLKQNSIKDISDEPFNDRVFKLKTVPKEKKLNLREFLENRPNVPIRRSINIIDSSSSRFISAIEKLKEKQKTVNTSKPESNLNVSTEGTNSKSVQNIVKTPIEKPMTAPIQKLDLKLSSPAFSLVSNNKQLFPSLTQDLSKSNAIESTDNSQITSKHLSMPSLSGDNTKSSQKTTTAFSLTKTKSGPELTQKDETVTEATSMASNIAKSVSFGNTTIINPIETTTDSNDFKLDTITECTENSETVSSTTVNSPFTSFQGFGGNVSTVGSALPKLSFNLSTTSSLFSLKSDSETPQKSDSLPKYEDISPPTTPQTTNPNQSLSLETNLTTITAEADSSKPLSILKSTLSAKPLTQNNENKAQKSNNDNNSIIAKASQSQSMTTSTEKSISSLAFTSVPTIITSSVVTDISSSTPTPTTTMPSFTSPTVAETANNTNISTKPLFGPQSQPDALDLSPKSSPTVAETTNISAKPMFGSQSRTEPPNLNQKSDQISSPFSQSAFGQTPFASNSFSFGNVSSNTGSAAPNFGQGLSFGGSTGFGQMSSAASKETTTASTGSLSFGQQTNALNNLSFCGLGGGPSPENVNKNVFGGNFSTSSPQTSQFTSTSQSSPFNVKSSSGGAFSGSFSSGSAVAQTGFGAFRQQSTQQSTPVFGGSPVFGGPQQPSFGGSPTFSTGTQQQSAFGSSPTFGGAPVMGSLNSSFGNTQTNAGFGGNSFTNTSNNGLSFGAIASTAQPPQQTTPFGSQFSFNSPSNAFGTTDQSQGFSFTQRRK